MTSYVVNILITSSRIYRVWFLFYILITQGDRKNHLEALRVDGRIILKCIFKNWDGVMDWIDLVQDRDTWQAFVNAVMNRRVT